eukprot:1274751-Pleurochrysis_carterae.AAC.2
MLNSTTFTLRRFALSAQTAAAVAAETARQPTAAFMAFHRTLPSRSGDRWVNLALGNPLVLAVIGVDWLPCAGRCALLPLNLSCLQAVRNENTGIEVTVLKKLVMAHAKRNAHTTAMSMNGR